MARTRVYCHPDNLEWVKKHFASKEEKQRKDDPNADAIHFLRPSWDMFEFIPNPALPKEQIKGYEKLVDRFTDWWDGKGEPPSWAIFFGFVKPIMEPLFYQVDDRSVMFRPYMDYGFNIYDTRKYMFVSSSA